VISDPPSDPGVTVYARVALAGVFTPEIVGAAGTRRGVELTAADASPVPMAFTARSFTEYAVPFVRELTTIGDNVLSAVTHVEPPLME
jgi:hypothetical protein